MARHRVAAILVATGLLVPAAGGADEPPPLNDLSMEVAALQTVYLLQLTPSQRSALREMVQKAAPQAAAARKPAKASAEFRQTLADLRAALATGDDAERIDKLSARVDELRQKEKPQLDDGFDLTDEAVEAAPRLLRLLTARQLAVYAGAFADDIADPLEEILEALPRVRDMDDRKWKEFRGGMTETLGTLLGGVDADRSGAYRDKVLQLLILTRGLSDADFKEQRPELEKKARAIVGNVGPLDVLRNYLESQLAELLSNPRLSLVLAQ